MAADPPAYLVDTNVLSRQGDQRPSAPVARWIERHAALIRISVITVAEMRRGLVLGQRKVDALSSPAARAREQAKLDVKLAWYRTLRVVFADRIEAIDADVAERWADVSVRFPSLRDGDKAILATALVRGFGVATRNVGDFRHTGVALANPFDPDTGSDAPA